MNSDDVLLQDFDELAIEAANSNPRVSIPRLSIPENILNSSKSSFQNVKIDESSNSFGQRQCDVLVGLGRLFVDHFDILRMISETVGAKVGQHLAKWLDAKVQLAISGQSHTVELLPLAELECNGQRPVFVVPADPAVC